jgi:hypothetical protein
MSAPGRPRILDDVKRGQVTALVAMGCGLASAARYVGCSINTIRREALRNDDFRQSLRRCEVRGQLDALQAMRESAKTHWRAAAWYLERVNPEQFDRRRAASCKPSELHDVVEAVVESAVEEIADDETRDRVCRRLMAAAHHSLRSLAALERSRLHPTEGVFDKPTSTEQRELDKLLDEINERQVSAYRSLKRENQNPRKSA